MKIYRSMMMLGALVAAPAAFAQTETQTAPAAPEAPAAQDATAPAAPAAGAATVTDSEISQFATAALEIAKVQKDAAVTDKNAKSVEVIQAAGLEPTRFNEIAQAMQADPALNKRIQEAAAKQVPATPSH